MSLPSESDMMSKELENSDSIYVNLMTDVFKIIVKYSPKIVAKYCRLSPSGKRAFVYCFQTENSHYTYFAHWVFILLAASFDNIWNSIECVINLDDIWRYQKPDIWVERYLTIFNGNLAIFYDRNVHTGARKLSPKTYRHLSPSGNRA